MEDWEKELILQNFEELARRTQVSANFIKELASGNVLNTDQLQNLESQSPSEIERSRQFYEVLLTVPNPLDLLLKLLDDTCQMDIVNLLLDPEAVFKNDTPILCDRRGRKVLRTGCQGRPQLKGIYKDRDIAVKVVAADVITIKSALREVKILKMLKGSKNILQYRTVQTSGQFINIAYEIFQSTLEDEINSNSLNLNGKEILTDCASGLAYLHKHNVVHTDLSPSSVLIGAKGQVKITDLDVAIKMRAGAKEVSVSYDRIVNKDWMPPEVLQQLAQKNKQGVLMSKSTDVFSLGCITYFVLSKGTHPFGNPIVRQDNIYNGKPQMDEKLITKYWTDLINKMISFDSRERSSVEEILLRIESFEIEPNAANRHNRVSNGQGTLAAVSSSTVLDSERAEDSPQNLLQRMEAIKNPASSTTTGHRARKRTASQIPECFTENMVVKKTKTCEQQLNDSTVGGSTSVKLKPTDIDQTDENGNNAIFRAILNDESLEEIKQLVTRGVDWRTRNNLGETVLHVATEWGNPEVLQYFIEKGADLKLKDGSGELPLHKLRNTKQIRFKHTLAVLRQNKVDMNSVNESGNTVLGLAALAGRSKDDFIYIICSGGDRNRRNQKGETMLHLAAQAGNAEVIKYLITTRAQVCSQDYNEEMPIHQVRFAKQNFSATLDALLDGGALINAVNKDGDTLLGLAAVLLHNKENLEYVVRKGAIFSVKNKQEQSVVHLSASSGNYSAIEYFSSLGVDVKTKDLNEEAAIHKLVNAEGGWEQSLEALLKHGANINEKNGKGNTILALAASQGKGEQFLEAIVAKGGDIFTLNTDEQSVLHLAAEAENVEAVKYFLSRGIRLDLKDINGMTALHKIVHSSNHNFKEMLDAMLKKGVDLNERNNNGNNLLFLAAGNGRSREELEYIVKKGGDYKITNKSQATVLHLAASGGNLAALDYFIFLGVDPLQKNVYGQIAMHGVSLSTDNFEATLDILLENGADINAVTNRGNTLLGLMAIKKGTENRLKYVVDNGGNAHFINSNNQNLMHLAAAFGNIEALKYFGKLEVDLRLRDKDGYTPLHMAVVTNHRFMKTVEVLLRLGANINERDGNDDTILFRAALTGKSCQELKYIISNGGDCRMKNKNGKTVMHYAVLGGNVEAIQYCFQLGVDLTSPDDRGYCPLHYVAYAKKNVKETLDVLLKLGVDINTTSNSSCTVLDLSILKGKSETDLAYMVSRDCDWMRKSWNEMTVVHTAAQCGNLDALKYFVGLGCDVNSKDSSRQTPLHKIAFATKNFPKMFDFLLDSGANINFSDENGNDIMGLYAREGKSVAELEHVLSRGGNFSRNAKNGQTVLHMAAEGGNVEAIRYLVDHEPAWRNVSDNCGELPLHRIRHAKKNFRQSLDTLLELGSKIDATDGEGNTLLCLAVRHGRAVEDIEYLLSKGTDRERLNNQGKSVLDFAREAQNEEIVKLLDTPS